jgi:hypothetical protein
VQALEGVLHHVLGGGHVADHQEGQADQFQVMVAEQARDRGRGVGSAGLGVVAGLAAQAARFARRVCHRVHVRETPAGPPALRPECQ